METPGKTVGNSKETGKDNYKEITMIITGIQVPEIKRQNGKHRLSFLHKC